MSKHEALAAVQACMIYLIICIIDHSEENEKHGPALLQALYVRRNSAREIKSLTYQTGILHVLQDTVWR
jgi:hypothetical protein